MPLRQGRGRARAVASRCGKGELVTPDRRQRRGQDDHAEGDLRRAARRPPDASLFEGEDITRASARRILAARHRALPRGPARVSLHDGAREPGDGLLPAHATRPASRPTWSACSSASRSSHERRDQAAGTLSGGEQQMLAISRALMSRPKLVLFDEPSLGLAPNLVERTFEIIKGIRARGRDGGDGGAERASPRSSCPTAPTCWSRAA